MTGHLGVTRQSAGATNGFYRSKNCNLFPSLSISHQRLCRRGNMASGVPPRLRSNWRHELSTTPTGSGTQRGTREVYSTPGTATPNFDIALLYSEGKETEHGNDGSPMSVWGTNISVQRFQSF
uniref:Uncharacterized protein n=1 Tax=Kalanchoe fedtschenkoi TaxID=63787 RepID=A0A7N0UZI5_KALFE